MARRDAALLGKFVMKAIWHNTILAESDDTVTVENNHYFPAESIEKQYFQPSEQTSYCPWKGTAHYHDLVVDGEVNPQAAWYYADPKEAAAQIKGRIAFWKGVEIQP